MYEHIRFLFISFKPLLLVLASLSLANINGLMTFLGLVISITYGLRKFYLLEKKNKHEKENEKNNI